MPIRSGILTLPISRNGKQAAETALISISELIRTPDLIRVTACFLIGLLIALWLTLQFPIPESTAVFLAQFG
jgi:hypothetical protein